LEREGLVHSNHDRGYSVCPLTEREVREVYPILAGLEVLALDESVAFVHPLLPQLTQINEDLASAKDPAHAIRLDSLWHDTLISHCSNGRLLAMIAGLRRTIFRYESVYMSDISLVNQSCVQHLDIIDRLGRGEIDLATDRLRENYRYGMESVVRKLVSSQ
jgi:DNA-binding GntR family transcriptional regulator